MIHFPREPLDSKTKSSGTTIGGQRREETTDCLGPHLREAHGSDFPRFLVVKQTLQLPHWGGGMSQSMRQVFKADSEGLAPNRVTRPKY